MRFPTITALCAAPLALAGTIQADVQDKREVQVIQGAVGGSATEVIVIWVNNGGGAATQTINQAVTVTQTVTAGTAGAATTTGAAAAAQTFQVTVGGAAGLVYSPEQVKANVGDFVEFTFMSTNHTVSQSAFTTPCDLLAGGMDSGFMANPNNSMSPPPKMQMQVTVATPLWFYCRQAGHCGKGMAFSINPTEEKTQAMFKQMAISQKGTGTPAVIAGGAGAAAGAGASSSAAAAPPPPAATASSVALAPPAAASMSPGTGATAGGVCSCTCMCGPGSFPAAAVQGLGGFGGIPGAMPMSAMMA